MWKQIAGRCMWSCISGCSGWIGKALHQRAVGMVQAAQGSRHLLKWCYTRSVRTVLSDISFGFWVVLYWARSWTQCYLWSLTTQDTLFYSLPVEILPFLSPFTFLTRLFWWALVFLAWHTLAVSMFLLDYMTLLPCLFIPWEYMC